MTRAHYPQQKMSSSISPVISVVCPVYNSRSFVSETLDSVICQTVQPFELLIVDDGSVDGSAEFIEEYLGKNNIDFFWQVIRLKHEGPGAARNAGIRAAKGDWIAFLDSDDRWYSKKLEIVRSHIVSHPDINFFCHDEIMLTNSGTELHLTYGKYRQNGDSLQSCLFARNVFPLRQLFAPENCLMITDRSMSN